MTTPPIDTHHAENRRPVSTSSGLVRRAGPWPRNSADVSHLSLTHRALPRPWLALDVDSARDIGQHTHRYPSEPLRRRLRHGQRLSPVPKGEPHRGYVPEVRETSGPLVDPRCTLIHVVPAWGTLPLSLAPSCRSQQVGAVRKSCGNRWERLVSAGHGLGRERTVNPSRKLPRFESLTCHQSARGALTSRYAGQGPLSFGGVHSARPARIRYPTPTSDSAFGIDSRWALVIRYPTPTSDSAFGIDPRSHPLVRYPAASCTSLTGIEW